MLIKTLHFKKAMRTYAADHSISLKNRVTVIAGDNGAGKSTLFGLIRHHFESPWTPSQMPQHLCEGVLEILPQVPEGSPITYIDLASDLLSTRAQMDDGNLDLHIRLLRKSSGQVALLQLVNVLKESKARIHLFDEPERGLSPAKQWVLGKILKHMVETRPEDQFLISTHSPQVMRALGTEVLQLPAGTYLPIDEYLTACDAFGHALAERYLEALKAEE